MCELMKQLNREHKNFEIKDLLVKCRYHTKKSEKFTHESILRVAKCLELFHAVYPKVLALMCDARFSEDELVMNCPNSENTVTIHLFTVPIKGIVKRFWNTIKDFLRPIYPMDVVRVVVNVKVLSVKGKCAAGYKEGDSFSIPHTGIICPQALYSIFPSILLSRDIQSCQCPSSVNRLVYQRSYDK